ncbi:cytochrome c biogenesis protein CcsA [Gammaproteobacteria bacterium]|nr:cytochrome c biogenesis protein CcsA [Gammaproteobacteria bacterium]
MSSYKKNYALQIFIWFFWILAIIGHVITILPIIHENYSVNLSLNYALIIVGLIISLTLYISSILGNTQYLGIILLPIISSIFLFDFSNDAVNVSLNNFLFLHVIISLISYSILCLSAAQSLILILQEKKLQNNKPIGIIASLPSLDVMDKLLFKILALGVIFLSASLLSGFIFLEDIFAQHLIHKTILSILAWLIFVSLIYGREKYGWRGRKAAKITLTGFFILFLSYFGTKIVLEIII